MRASAQAIWDAITTPEWTERYGYRAPAHYDLRPGGSYRSRATQEMLGYGAPEVVVEGEVLEVDPPHRLVQTRRMLFSPELVAEALTRLAWEIDEGPDGVCTLTVTHDLAGAPVTRPPSAARTRGPAAMARRARRPQVAPRDRGLAAGPRRLTSSAL